MTDSPQSPDLLRSKSDELLSKIEIRWFQCGMSTFFWAGVVNAVFCCGGLWSLYEGHRVLQQVREVELANKQAERDLRDLLWKINKERYETRVEWERVAKWWEDKRSEP